MLEANGQSLEQRVVEVLRTVYDPEIPVNIYDLGLIYNIDIGDEGPLRVRMTLTSPACPVAGALVDQVRSKLQALEGVGDVDVELVWDPPWSPEKMSEEAKLQLNL